MNENYRKINTLLDVLSDKDLTQEESEWIEEIKKSMGKKENQNQSNQKNHFF